MQNKKDKGITFRLTEAMVRLNIFGIDVNLDDDNQIMMSFPMEYADNLAGLLEEVADAEDEIEDYFREEDKK